MENQIVDSQFRLLGTHFSNGVINIDIGSLLIFVALIFIGSSIYAYIKYLRDKNCIYDSKDMEELKSDNKYLFRKLEALDDRVSYLEEKDESVSNLHKSINELKKLIKNQYKSEA